MGSYLVPNAFSTAELIRHVKVVPSGTRFSTVEGGILVEIPDVEDAVIASRFAGFTPMARSEQDWPLLPEELRPHAAHIVAFGQVTQAEIDAVFPPGSVANRMAHVVRDLCRGMIVLVDPRLED